MPSLNPISARRFWPVMLTTLAVSLGGCKTLPEAQPVEVRIPAPPPLTTPLPSVGYSESVQQSFKTWQQKLTDTSKTSGD